MQLHYIRDRRQGDNMCLVCCRKVFLVIHDMATA